MTYRGIMAQIKKYTKRNPSFWDWYLIPNGVMFVRAGEEYFQVSSIGCGGYNKIKITYQDWAKSCPWKA